MLRLLYAVIVGLVGAGIVHAAVVLLIPSMTETDAWSRLEDQAPLYMVTRADPVGAAPIIQSPDPLFDAVACRFDLSDGILQLRAEGRVPYWSLSIYDRVGQNVYSVNDRTSSDGLLDYLIATPAQLVQLRNELPEEFKGSIFVETDIEEGIVVVRAFVPDPSMEEIVGTFLSDMDCDVRE